MKFKVYELVTDKDVTDKQEWYIDTEGTLYYITNDIDAPLYMYMASGEYYYKLEIEVL